MRDLLNRVRQHQSAASSQPPTEERVPDSSVTDVGNQTSEGSGEVVVSDDLADLSSHSNSVSPQETSDARWI